MRRYGLAIFDRDGVLIEDGNYLADPQDIVWVPGAIHCISRLKKRGCSVVVATNQSGIARGLLTYGDVDRIHQRMQSDLGSHETQIDRFYVCPFHPDASVAAYRHPNHPDRKPNPGLLQRAMREFGVTPEMTFMVGDKATDVIAADRAGTHSIRYFGGDLSCQLAADGVML
jgi:D-glycero-D-manno-heptose 1,7-bisphosphate phosphatase